MSEQKLETTEAQKYAIKTIIESSTNDIPEVSESIFIQEILPIITNHNGNKDLTKWLTYAGSYQQSIRVLDNQTRNTLFIVPSLINGIESSIINNGFFESLTMANLISERHPGQGKNHLLKSLSNKIPKAKIDIEKITQLNSILARYNYPPIYDFKSENETINSEENKKTQLNVEFSDELSGFDEL